MCPVSVPTLPPCVVVGSLGSIKQGPVQPCGGACRRAQFGCKLACHCVSERSSCRHAQLGCELACYCVSEVQSPGFGAPDRRRNHPLTHRYVPLGAATWH